MVERLNQMAAKPVTAARACVSTFVDVTSLDIFKATSSRVCEF